MIFFLLEPIISKNYVRCRPVRIIGNPRLIAAEKKKKKKKRHVFNEHIGNMSTWKSDTTTYSKIDLFRSKNEIEEIIPLNFMYNKKSLHPHRFAQKNNIYYTVFLLITIWIFKMKNFSPTLVQWRLKRSHRWLLFRIKVKSESFEAREKIAEKWVCSRCNKPGNCCNGAQEIGC